MVDKVKLDAALKEMEAAAVSEGHAAEDFWAAVFAHPAVQAAAPVTAPNAAEPAPEATAGSVEPAPSAEAPAPESAPAVDPA